MTSLEQVKCKALADDIADNVELTPAVFDAFANTQREIFAPVARYAYSLDAHPIEGDQWISSPLTVAKMTLALECENVDNVLEIGCGSGYQAAILSKLAHRIFSVERIQKLANEAKKRFEKIGIKNIHVRFDDGNIGWIKYAPYERIMLSCACKVVPDRLFDQLKEGGILVAPVEKDGKQYICKYTKIDNSITEYVLDQCYFVPLLDGTQS
ncbi:protein-L-isoaspartate O-methyltransferase [Campylobacter mucosalis]|uniref:protein-L-isoaspartate(D-aspartate) O-methyltransferase n=1 Tax=Campylobacter mucosalis TaxID=202 RepID=UPI0004D85908|nr:protein-L-isoaspartate(D-aspartate) O-methyltransferase [Campylobacter mucosalis]KEA45318.1 protein-L-isoaspartate O-methyltransferase [Campylobacter mucosalis]QKF62248.1 L-isoaspartate protein carboxylmethyltransferase, type II [Campylobacter mucosalis]